MGNLELTEEQVTKQIMDCLRRRGYTIHAFDFPQSGTGKPLHPDDSLEKNKGMIIPDIIAVRGEYLIIMENKDRFVKGDFDKLHLLKQGSTFAKAIAELHEECRTSVLLVGSGMPDKESHVNKVQKVANLVDFVMVTNADGVCRLVKGRLP